PRVLGYPPNRVWGRRSFRLDDGRWVRRTLTSSYDRERQLHHVCARYQPLEDDRRTPRGPALQHRLTQRQFFPEELVALVRAAGFEVVLRLGEFDGRVFEGSSPSQILYCRPAAG